MEKKLTWKKLNTKGNYFTLLKLRVIIEEDELDLFIKNLCFYNVPGANEEEKKTIFEEFKSRNQEFFKEKEEIFSICHRRYGIGKEYSYFVSVEHLLYILESVVIPCEE